MGNSAHKFLQLMTHGGGQKQNQQSKEEEDIGSQNRLPPSDILTDKEIDYIKLCWPHLRPCMYKIMTQAFLDLFVASPDIKDKFVGFRNLTVEDLRKVQKDNPLHHHVPRVIHSIVKVVIHIDNLDEVLDYLECIGKIHHKNGILCQEMAFLAPFFVAAAAPHLPPKMQEQKEIIDSLTRLFIVMTNLMRRGYPNAEVELTEREMGLIRYTFSTIQENMADIGATTFIRLFHIHSTSKMFFPLFKDSPLEDISVSQALRNHGLRVMKVIERVVLNLEYPTEATDTYLAQLGTMHQTKGIEKKYLDVMGPIFCDSIRPILQEENQWNMEIRNAWLHLFRIIVIKMKRGYKEESPASLRDNGSGRQKQEENKYNENP